MSDNVVKFRQPAKPPKPELKKPRGKLPSWLPFAVLLAIALAIYAAGQAGHAG